MAGHKLIVEVVSANGLTSSLDLLNSCVELRFAGQSFTTSVKEKVRCPEWNERMVFDLLDKERLPSLTLDGYVYNVIEGSRIFLGKVRIPGTSFADSSDEVVKGYQLKGGIFQRSKGMLLLRVFLKKEVPVATPDPFAEVIPLESHGTVQPVDAVLREITPKIEDGMIVERLLYLFVRVLKARELPDVDANGKLDPYVKVNAGPCRGTTKLVHKERNPEWNATFAFPKRQLDHDQVTRVYVVVNDYDSVQDDFVGMVTFDLINILERSPTDKPVVPKWHRLTDERGRTSHGELLLAVWMGSQADEAFVDSFTLDWSTANTSVMPHIGPKVYDSPNLWYLRVRIIEFQCIAVAGDGAKIVELSATAVVGEQRVTTKKVKRPLSHCVWDEEFMFVAAEPFEDDLQLTVEAHMGPSRDKILGQVAIPVETFQRRVDGSPVERQWFDLRLPQKEIEASDTDGGRDGDEFVVSSCHIHVNNCLDGGYSVLSSSSMWKDDLRPAATEICNPPLGLLEVGILEAHDLRRVERRNRKSTLNPYCVARYGRKWLRTRTIINNIHPSFHEQYAWDVYDTATVLTIGVFDNARAEDCYSNEDKDALIGGVRMCLSSLQPGRIYSHAYPLIVLKPSGVRKMGELYLSIRFTTKSLINMLRMYTCPMLPKLHYEHPLSILILDRLRRQATRVVACRLSRTEHPLPREVVECMSEVPTSPWSMRKSKVNFFRIVELFRIIARIWSWLGYVRSWKNPAITLLAHAIFFLALLYHQFILPSVLLYIFIITAWSYKDRPKCPPHVDFQLLESAHLDELDEEFDSFPSSKSFDIIRVRYDRLRAIAGRLQTVVGDLATQGERIYALTSWRDPIATAIFSFLTLAGAVFLCVIPWKIIAAIIGLYTMRPPMFRRKAPSFILNYFRRLPGRAENIL